MSRTTLHSERRWRRCWTIGLIALAFGITLGVRFWKGPMMEHSSNDESSAAVAPPTAGHATPHVSVAEFSRVQPPGAPAVVTAAELEAVDNETEPMRREELLASILDRISAAEIPAALMTLQYSDWTDAADDLGGRLSRRWAETDAPAAAAGVSGAAGGAVGPGRRGSSGGARGD